MNFPTTPTSVRDLFVETLALKRRGMSPRSIADKVVDLARGHGRITAHDVDNGVGIEITFHATGETIHFDGAEWHHLREPAAV